MRVVFGLLSVLFGASCGGAPASEEEVGEHGAAAVPAGYYNGVDASSASTLRATLHPVIDDHQRYPYTSTATDTWNMLEAAQEIPETRTASSICTATRATRNTARGTPSTTGSTPGRNRMDSRTTAARTTPIP